MYYTELIQKLTTQLNNVEEENVELKEKLSNCEGKLEVLQLFYSDFKHLFRTDVIYDNISSEIASMSPKNQPEYSSQLADYLLTGDENVLKHLFEDYGVNTSQILTDIRNKLPQNIISLVKQYKCKNEYLIIVKSIKNIKKFTKGNTLMEKSIMDLVHQYINYYNKDKKEIALKILRQALIYFPFQFDKFLENIKQCQYDDLDQYIENLKVELYGKGNILLINNINLPKPEKKKMVSEKKPENSEITLVSQDSTKRTFKRIDYSNTSVDVLVKIVQNIKDKFINNSRQNNSRQKALRIYEELLKAKRTDDCYLFLEEVNKLLTKKISPK